MLRTSWQESPKYTERSNTRILASANRPGPQPAENKEEVVRFLVGPETLQPRALERGYWLHTALLGLG